MMGDPKRGLYEKFLVTRTDGRSAEGEKHHECQYFVLDLTHDKFAMMALERYAMTCAGEYPILSADLTKLLDEAIRDGRFEI